MNCLNTDFTVVNFTKVNLPPLENICNTTLILYFQFFYRALHSRHLLFLAGLVNLNHNCLLVVSNFYLMSMSSCLVSTGVFLTSGCNYQNYCKLQSFCPFFLHGIGLCLIIQVLACCSIILLYFLFKRYLRHSSTEIVA